MVYRYQWDVTAGDTDYSGRIYTPTAVDAMLQAIERLLIEVDLEVQESVIGRGLQLPVVHTEVDYLSEFGAGVTIDIDTAVTIGESSLVFTVVGYRSGEPVFQGNTVMVLVDDESHDTVPIPDWVREPLAPHEGDQQTVK